MIRKAIIGLLVFASITTAGLYVFSFANPRREFYLTPAYQLSAKDGKFFVGHIFRVKPPEPSDEPPSVHSVFGFSYWRLVSQGRGAIVLTVPLWTFLVLFAAYPTLSAFLRGPRRRADRRRRGLCLKCGYNLKGNESGVCPECGTAIGRP